MPVAVSRFGKATLLSPSNGAVSVLWAGTKFVGQTSARNVGEGIARPPLTIDVAALIQRLAAESGRFADLNA